MRLFFIAMLLLCLAQAKGQVSISTNNTPPDNSAMLDISSTNKGLLIPRMSTEARNAIVFPVKGLMVMDTTMNSLYYYSGVSWGELSYVNSNSWIKSGNNIRNSNLGNVGINVDPQYPLDVRSNSGITFNVTNLNTDGNTTAINSRISSPAGAAVFGSSGFATAPFENSRFGVVGSTLDDGVGVGGFARDAVAVRARTRDGVGVRTNTYGAGLSIHSSGAIRFDGIGEGENKVLTSDALGNATWQTSSLNAWTLNGNNIFNSNPGNVGIGINTPLFPLSFSNTVGNKISFSSSNGTSLYGLGVQTNKLQIFTESAAGDIAFGHGSSGSFTQTAVVKGNGEVTASAYKYTTAKTNYYSIPNISWTGTILSEPLFGDYYVGSYSPAAVGTAIVTHVPVNLPHGAVITNVRLYLMDHDPNYSFTSAQLFRSYIQVSPPHPLIQSIGSVATLCPDPICYNLPEYNFAPASANATVDNNLYSYYLEIKMQASNLIRIFQTLITYSTTAAD